MRTDTTDPATVRSDVIHAFGNETRIQLLSYLAREGPAFTTDAAHELGVHTSTARTHFRRLRDVGLVSKHREQGDTYWMLTDEGDRAVEKVVSPLLEFAKV